jgi:radical SAM superfamily enzyme YgiQ (UPF0313 family)
VATNVSAGVRDVSLMSEDFFRYGGKGTGRTSPQALIGLLHRLRAIRDVRTIQPAHANIASLADFSDAELAETRRLLAGDSPQRHVWVNVGIETASGALLESAGSRAKMRPFSASQWADRSGEQVRRLTRAGFTPMISLLLGIPGETASHLDETGRWVRSLRRERALVFPVFLAAIRPGTPSFSEEGMTSRHWRLFEECYRFNFRWNLPMLWEDETAAGVGLARRLTMQLLGRCYILWWKALLTLGS